MDRNGETIDFLLTVRRDNRAALRFLRKAIRSCGKPGLINIDTSGANAAAIWQYNKEESTRIWIRQCKYLHNIVEQDHRQIKQITKPVLGFKSLHCALRTLADIELIRMLRKGQLRCQACLSKTLAEQFYALAA